MIKRFELVDNADKLLESKEHMRKCNASFINTDVTRWISKTLKDDIMLFIGFPDDLIRWNDFDFVIVMDDSFVQPYTPFYAMLNGRIKGFQFLNEVIEKYNECMSSFPFIVEITK